MAASNANPGYGTLLAIGEDSDPEIYTNIAEIVSISGPSISREAIDVTNLMSDSMFREFRPGIIDFGEISLDFNFLPDDTEQAGLFADMIDTTPAAGVLMNYRLLFPDLLDRSLTFTAAAEDICTAVGHGLTTGQAVTLTTSVILPPPLAINTTYWVAVLDDDTFELCTTEANAKAGTQIDITDIGTGTHTLHGQDSLLFKAQPTNFEPASAVEGKLGLSVTLKLSGAITSTM